MLRKEIYGPILRVKFGAQAVADAALVAHYVGRPSYLAALEREVEQFERALGGLRLALQAVRSRGEDPTREDWDVDDVPV